MSTIYEFVERVATAQSEKTAIEKITNSNPTLTLEEAYEIQRLSIEKSISASNAFIGWKMGLTSKAKQLQVGVESTIYGRLTNNMLMNHNEITAADHIHPRIEPEVAFTFKSAIAGENLTPYEVWSAVEYVYLALEVIDSRYENFAFSLMDVIADNASSTKFLMGSQPYAPTTTDWAQIKVDVYHNGERKYEGVGAAILDHPIHSVIELLNMLSKEGRGILPGQLVLAGAMTDAVAVKAGDTVTADYGVLGSLTINVK
ncbi:2-keto-4-pentenoate hydratase [Solibacillus daqui]|uniref:2-keto-4-pentenoate hydratase n=1 Tax=Solibacillus daqui TaxID=2912187 RepID=UPI002365CC8B|nr:fumarylacetoacetate hydrolase family protein [Solibacillus daqui]